MANASHSCLPGYSLVPRLSPLRRALPPLSGESLGIKDHLTDGVLFLLDVGFFSCGHGSHVCECEALHTSCDQARRAGDGRTIMIIGASLSEPHIDGTTGRFHICIITR